MTLFFSCYMCHSLTSLEGAPKEVGIDFYIIACYGLKALIHVPKCRELMVTLRQKDLLQQYISNVKDVFESPIVATYEDIVSSPKYKQELAIEASVSKTKAKLEAKHQDGEKTAPKKQVASAVNATVLKTKESRDI